MHHGHAQMTTWPKVETETYIWTKFGTELKYYTINTPEWPNSHKYKMAAATILDFLDL